jgi:hypothetical protein
MAAVEANKAYLSAAADDLRLPLRAARAVLGRGCPGEAAGNLKQIHNTLDLQGSG